MQDLQQRLKALGIAVPEIILPKPEVDLLKWAVIACDQFTQDKAYWSNLADFVGKAPSTLNLIFPEIYLGDQGMEERIQTIHQTMDTYLANGVFASPKRGFMYVERTTPYHQCRRGLVTAVDLEQYDWKKDALVRATEETVAERLPPRMAIRRGAALECSHVLFLVADEEDCLLSGLGDRAKTGQPAYHTPLTAGAISGWFLNSETDLTFLAEKLEALAQKSIARYGFLYAVGDGNHSLASAKAIWEEYKTREQGLMDHPSRYALVEIENIYDPGLSFEPIHRLLLGATPAETLTLFAKLPGFTSRHIQNSEELSSLVEEEKTARTRFGIIAGKELILAEYDALGLAADQIQPLLDTFISDHGCSIDYIHGQFGETEIPGVGILLPPVNKNDLFKTVANRGPLPRKSFSMGEALEKRFYLECRKLFC